VPDLEGVIAHVHAAFDPLPYPGDAFLQGSHEGCEPFEECGAFVGRTEWRALEPEFLDGHHSALSFLSEAGFRFFLPAYLVADAREQLMTADPVFHLTHGLTDEQHEERVGDRTFVRRWGRHSFVNPRRYGACTWWDHAQRRLGVFTREEAGAIVTYLQHAAERAELPQECDRITRALDTYWLERARAAPTAADLQRQLDEEAAFHAALRAKYGGGT
jgi:hypothetical protein